MRWLYHYIAWRIFGGHYSKHQCEQLLYRGDTVYGCCVRAKHHFGKHDFNPGLFK